MDGVEENPTPRFEIDEALLEALRKHGGPLILTYKGEEVAGLLTTDELERLEDERDIAVAEERYAEWLAEGRPRSPTLEDVAADAGMKLRSTR